MKCFSSILAWTASQEEYEEEQQQLRTPRQATTEEETLDDAVVRGESFFGGAGAGGGDIEGTNSLRNLSFAEVCILRSSSQRCVLRCVPSERLNARRPV